jgi:hypothetical protein
VNLCDDSRLIKTFDVNGLSYVHTNTLSPTLIKPPLSQTLIRVKNRPGPQFITYKAYASLPLRIPVAIVNSVTVHLTIITARIPVSLTETLMSTASNILPAYVFPTLGADTAFGFRLSDTTRG